MKCYAWNCEETENLIMVGNIALCKSCAEKLVKAFEALNKHKEEE
jgi:hypothetical protein